MICTYTLNTAASFEQVFDCVNDRNKLKLWIARKASGRAANTCLIGPQDAIQIGKQFIGEALLIEP